MNQPVVVLDADVPAAMAIAFAVLVSACRRTFVHQREDVEERPPDPGGCPVEPPRVGQRVDTAERRFRTPRRGVVSSGARLTASW